MLSGAAHGNLFIWFGVGTLQHDARRQAGRSSVEDGDGADGRGKSARPVRLTSADTLAKASAGAVVGGRAGHVSGGVERRRPASRSVDHVDRRAGVSTSLLRSALFTPQRV